MEEVRSGHDEEPEAPLAAAAGGATVWDDRMDELGARYPTAVLSLVAPDGFPFSVRVPVAVDRGARVRIRRATPAGRAVQPGLACLTAHDHAPDFTWQRNFQVRGDLVEDGRRLGARAAQAGRRLRAAARVEARALPAEREQDDALPQGSARARA